MRGRTLGVAKRTKLEEAHVITLKTDDLQVIAELAQCLNGFTDCANVGRFMLIPFGTDNRVLSTSSFDYCYFTYTSAKKLCKKAEVFERLGYCCWLVSPLDCIGSALLRKAEQIELDVNPSTLEVVQMRVLSGGRMVARWPNRDGFFEEALYDG